MTVQNLPASRYTINIMFIIYIMFCCPPAGPKTLSFLFFLRFFMVIITLEPESGSEYSLFYIFGSVSDPDPPDSHVFGPPGSGSFYH
jgi:hypothetical protein